MKTFGYLENRKEQIKDIHSTLTEKQSIPHAQQMGQCLSEIYECIHYLKASLDSHNSGITDGEEIDRTLNTPVLFITYKYLFLVLARFLKIVPGKPGELVKNSNFRQYVIEYRNVMLEHIEDYGPYIESASMTSINGVVDKFEIQYFSYNSCSKNEIKKFFNDLFSKKLLTIKKLLKERYSHKRFNKEFHSFKKVLTQYGVHQPPLEDIHNHFTVLMTHLHEYLSNHT